MIRTRLLFKNKFSSGPYLMDGKKNIYQREWTLLLARTSW